MPQFPRPVLLVMAVFPLAVGVFSFYSITKERRLAEGYETTTGVIRGSVPNSHGNLSYSYEVGGMKYYGVGPAGDRVETGDTTEVFYSTSDPTNSSLRHPDRPGFDDYLLPLGCFGVFIALVATARRRKSLEAWAEEYSRPQQEKTGEPSGRPNAAEPRRESRTPPQA